MKDAFPFVRRRSAHAYLATLSQSIHVDTGLSPMTPVSRLMALVFWFGFPRIRP